MVTQGGAFLKHWLRSSKQRADRQHELVIRHLHHVLRGCLKAEPKHLLRSHHPIERAFLEALADTCNVRLACALSNISRSSAYLWRQEDPAFKQRWEEAAKIGAAALEEEAIRRAREGWVEPVYYRGEVRGEVRKYSDTLLIFLLKGAMPEKYRERIDSNVHHNGLSRLTDEELQAKLDIALSEYGRAPLGRTNAVSEAASS